MAIETAVNPEIIEAEIRAEKTHTSKGEKLFDILTYGGISGLGVFLLGIPIGYWGKYGKGAGLFKSMSQTIQKTGLSTHVAEDVAMASVLMQPGNISILPVKLMENNKPGLVEKFNGMLGDKSSDSSVDEEPRQTWGSLVKGRIAAWLAAFAGFRGAGMILGNEKFAAFEEKFAEHIVCKPLGKPTHIPGMEKIAANETKLFRYGRIAALDIFATTAATIILYVGSKFFARQNEHWHAQHAHVHAKPAEPDTSGPPPLSPQTLESREKFHAHSISPRQNDIIQKIRPEKFADALNDQKSCGCESSLSLGT